MPLDLAVGEVAEPGGLVGEGMCIESVDPADYVVVVTVGDAGAAREAHEIDILGSGFETGSGSLLSTVAASATPGEGILAAPRGFPPGGALSGAGGVDVVRPVFPVHDLASRMRSAPGGRARPLARNTVPARAAPSVGDVREYPTAVSCDTSPDARRGRVVAVSQHAVVLLDEESPSPGFSDAELQDIAGFFDEYVYAPLTDVFGTPSDLDANGRVVVFFTPAANALSTPGSGGVVGGFFWGGDLFPRENDPGSGLAGCATSAEGEVLYMSVPDPDGLVAAPIRGDQLQTRAVLAHELQHLLNASRRLYVNDAEVLEETWLNEGLSYVAEELLFHEVTGVRPKQNLDGPTLETRGIVDAFNRYAYGNLGRYNVFLQAPHVHSPMGPDVIETRGAAWAFLRYVIDRTDRPDREVLYALMNSRERGLGTLENALGVDPLDRMAEWAVTLVADDLSGGRDPRYQQPSWAMPSLIASLRADRRYPLLVVGIPPDQGVRFSLRSGSAGFGSLRLEPFSTAHIRVSAPGAARARGFLVRVR